MKITAKTIDNVKVAGDMFKYSGTHGIPLEITLMFLQKENMVMDWLDYIKDALKDGHNPKTIKGRIKSAVGEVYGPHYRDEVMKRVDIILVT